MHITYQYKGNPPDGYVVHIRDENIEEYHTDVATLGRKIPADFYTDRPHWERYLKSLGTYLRQSSKVVLHLHGKFLKKTEYTLNVLRLILQTIGVHSFSKKGASIVVLTSEGDSQSWMKECIDETLFVIEAQLVAMLPANVATPQRMQSLLRKLFRPVSNVKVNVLSSKDLHTGGFGLITAVGQGARASPYMVVVERKGRTANAKTIAIAGKGVTFDSGGMSLKPNAQLLKMKYDKIGAVYGAYALYQMMRDPTLREHTLIGVFPFAENALSANAIHSGDVVKSYLGKTVEITDPDAEGRLLLADAFAFLHSYHPDVLLDIATLTGHSETIHCDHAGYFFASVPSWKNDIEKGSYMLGERMIAMPSWTNGYDGLLTSPVADLVNSPSKKECTSSSFVATLFLKEFVPEKCDWLHIDLAHELDGSVPVGHGIRTLIYSVHAWVRKNDLKIRMKSI